MKRHVFTGISLGIFVCLLLLGFSRGHAAEEKTYSFKFAHLMAPDTPQVKYTQEWAKEVEKRTNGRVKFTVYAGGTLVPAGQTYDSIVKGIADAGYSIFAYHRGRFPLTEVVDLPLGYKKSSVATRMINEYYKKFNPKELQDTKVLWLNCHGPGMLHMKSAVKTLEELKGVKVRCTGLGAKIIGGLEATPVSMPVPDTFDALSKGVVQGVLLDIGGLHIYKLGDYVRYHIESPGIAYTTGMYTVMNKEKWNSLTPDLQKIIDTINTEWIERACDVWDKFDLDGREAMTKKGNTIIPLTKEEDARWAEKMKPIIDEYVQASKAKNLPGEDALKFCVDYLKANQK